MSKSRYSINDLYEFYQHNKGDHKEDKYDSLATAIFSLAAATLWASNNIAASLDGLGLNGADTQMGALELVAKEISKLKEQ